MTWLDQLTVDTVIVHTVGDGPSIKGLRTAVWDDGIVLRQAALVQTGEVATLAGEIFVPREKILMVQILPPEGVIDGDVADR